MKLQVIESSGTFACGTYGPLAVSIWDGAASSREAEAAAQTLRTLSVTRNDIVILAILGPDAPPAGNEVRDIISRAVREAGAKVRAAATVVEGQGFRAAAMRAALLGMSMVVRNSHPQKSFATVGEAATFLQQYSDELREHAIVQAVAQLRTR